MKAILSCGLKLWLIIGLVFYSQPWAISQSLEDIRKTVIGDSVILNYDLVSPNENLNYEIRLYGITGNYRQRLFRAEGDIGRYQKGGFNKQIVWVKNVELIGYPMNEISFDIQYAFLDPVLSVSFPRSRSVLKRGETYQVRWLGGESVKLDLIRGENKVATLGSAKGKGVFEWRVAANVKPGNKYRIRVESENNPGNAVYSKSFKVKRKVPMALRVIPLVGVTVVAIIIANKESDDTDDLPEPINPN